MQEYGKDAHGWDKANGKEPDSIEAAPHRAPIGKLVTHNALRHHPANEDTGEERA